MLQFGIDSDPIADPGFISLADTGPKISFHEVRLNRQFPRQPEIIGVEKGDIFPAGLGDAGVAGGANAGARLSN